MGARLGIEGAQDKDRTNKNHISRNWNDAKILTNDRKIVKLISNSTGWWRIL